MPGDYLSWADWGFLQTYHLRACCRLRYKGKDGCESGLGSAKSPCRHANPKVGLKHQKALTAFILSLSDQQLVTGPAMVVAALSQRCNISVYEFNIVSSVAWLSSTTHLSTLIVLRQYFRQNGTVRNIRIVGMLVNLSLVIYTVILTNASTFVDGSVHIECISRNLWPLLSDTSIYLPMVMTISFLVLTYSGSILQLYSEGHAPLKSWLRYFCCKRKNGPQLSDEDFQRWYTDKVWHSKFRLGSAVRRDIRWRRAIVTTGHRWDARNMALIIVISRDYQNSFLSELPPILFSISYGITQFIKSREESPSIQGSENSLDFGQIVPIFLLALPFLSGVEAYCEGRSSKMPVASAIYSHLLTNALHRPGRI